MRVHSIMDSHSKLISNFLKQVFLFVIFLNGFDFKIATVQKDEKFSSQYSYNPSSLHKW